jgi:hypothetical protein
VRSSYHADMQARGEGVGLPEPMEVEQG